MWKFLYITRLVWITYNQFDSEPFNHIITWQGLIRGHGMTCRNGKQWTAQVTSLGSGPATNECSACFAYFSQIPRTWTNTRYYVFFTSYVCPIFQSRIPFTSNNLYFSATSCTECCTRHTKCRTQAKQSESNLEFASESQEVDLAINVRACKVPCSPTRGNYISYILLRSSKSPCSCN